MSETANFEDILNQNAADFKAPPAFPRGLYRLRVSQKDPYELGQQNNKKKTPFCQVHFEVVAVHKLETPSQMDELDGIELSKKTISNKWWTTPDAVFMLTDSFMKDSLGMTFAEGETIAEALAQIGGLEVLGMLDRQKNEKTGREYNIIESFLNISAAAATEVE